MALSDIAARFTFPAVPAIPNRLATEGFAHRFERSINNILAEWPASEDANQMIIEALCRGIVAGVTRDLDSVPDAETHPDQFILAGFVATVIAETQRV